MHPINFVSDTHFLDKSPRHRLFVFNLALDIHVMVNRQLSKRVSSDQCHMTVSRAQVYNSWFLKFSVDWFLVFN